MKKRYFIFLSVLLTGMIVLQACGSSKGYSGAKLQDGETARVEGGTHKVKIKGKKTSEQALLVKVDSLTVGSFMKGYPKNVNVKPGEVTLEIRHFCQWNDKSAMAGAMFGIIGASVAESNNPHKHYRITFPVEKGKTYVLMPETDEETLEPRFVIIDKATNDSFAPSKVVEIVKKSKE